MYVNMYNCDTDGPGGDAGVPGDLSGGPGGGSGAGEGAYKVMF